MTTYNSHATQRMAELEGTQLASFIRRALAFGADLAAASILFIPAAMALEPLARRLGWLGPGQDIVFALNYNWYSVAWILLYFGLGAYFGDGRTPGKRLLGIRVVSLSHHRLSLWHSLERALGYGTSVLEFGFGFF